MGIRSLRSLLPTTAQLTTAADQPFTSAPASDRSAGLLTDILNPKVGVLFISVLPGFVPDGSSVGWTTLGFGLLYVGMTALYCGALIAASTKIAHWMHTPHVRRRLDTLTGLVLVGFGLRLATEA